MLGEVTGAAANEAESVVGFNQGSIQGSEIGQAGERCKFALTRDTSPAWPLRLNLVPEDGAAPTA